MTDKWQLTEQQLRELLLVSKVRLNVLKNDYNEEMTDETSKSTDRNQTTAQSCKHNKTRS
jgi:septum formation inhibitor MinC